MALASSDAGVYGQRALLCCATAVAALHHPAAPESPFAIARARRNCRAPRPSSTRLARSPRSRPTPPALIGAPQLPATPSHQSCLLGDMFSPGRGVLNIMSPAPAPFSISGDLPASSSPPPPPISLYLPPLGTARGCSSPKSATCLLAQNGMSMHVPVKKSRR
jgi:hypothetical protein